MIGPLKAELPWGGSFSEEGKKLVALAIKAAEAGQEISIIVRFQTNWLLTIEIKATS